ncbi:sensor histidine kinase [Deinococcus radiotolerans]|uniref:histidine kinase n=1 Tax=Deinococcus radiotolerans TaxID=1309407 RepID=A0ABQ2FI37_9DEIO|nr:ATP-binding protein [Deinococcus radiotolerans]GGK99075.1 two-component sensor histidine kinase [Deinococcus radiotolerans]
MKLFPRLFLAHLLVILVALGALLLVAEWTLPGVYQHHVEQMVQAMGDRGRALRPDLEAGMRGALTGALLLALPFAAGAAAVTALLTSRRVVRSVALLGEGSRDLAGGQYARRLPEQGRDELSELARNFNRLAAALERVEQDRVALIGEVGHELRTPLAALRGYSEALLDGVLPPAAVAPAVEREVRFLERLAQDLSLVSRAEAGHVELDLRNVPVQDLLDAARDRFAEAFAARGVDLRVARSASWVRADPERAGQVLANLLHNAARHTPPGGTVRLDVLVGDAQVALTVHDAGPGIAPEHLERIFERFYRVNEARTRGEGSGVGLTIARALAQRMGGSLNVTSSAAGSVFTFTLPRVTAESRHADPEQVEPAGL